jgi:hypothetical protein
MISVAICRRAPASPASSLAFRPPAGTYYQARRTRQEAKLARQGIVYSENCLEFVPDEGTTLNLIRS